jgi:hypothetical protein
MRDFADLLSNNSDENVNEHKLSPSADELRSRESTYLNKLEKSRGTRTLSGSPDFSEDFDDMELSVPNPFCRSRCLYANALNSILNDLGDSLVKANSVEMLSPMAITDSSLLGITEEISPLGIAEEISPLGIAEELSPLGPLNLKSISTPSV